MILGASMLQAKRKTTDVRSGRRVQIVMSSIQSSENQNYRRRIHRQMNKGEAHALRRFLFFAHEGKVRRRQADQQTNLALCLNLVSNTIVTVARKIRENVFQEDRKLLMWFDQPVTRSGEDA